MINIRTIFFIQWTLYIRGNYGYEIDDDDYDSNDSAAILFVTGIVKDWMCLRFSWSVLGTQRQYLYIYSLCSGKGSTPDICVKLLLIVHGLVNVVIPFTKSNLNVNAIIDKKGCLYVKIAHKHRIKLEEVSLKI